MRPDRTKTGAVREIKMAEPRTLDVQSFLDENPFSAFQWMIFGLCFFVVFLDGFDTAAIGYIAPSLLSEWGFERSALAPVLSAALFGLATGALLSGPITDRVGRRTMLVCSVTIFGVACLASSFSGSLSQLVAWRFVTGLGLGSAMPNAVTMMSEFLPTKWRATLTNTMFCGFPLGAAFGGFLAAWIIPQFGWRSVLVFGGLVPLVLAALIFGLMPESVRYMVASGASADRIRGVLRRISPSANSATSFVAREAKVSKATGGLGIVFSQTYVVGTITLWTAYFMGLVVFYAMINWMPVLFKDVGLSTTSASVVTALFPLGGVFAIFAGWVMDRLNGNVTVAICFGLTAVALWAIGRSGGNIAALTVLVVVAGVLLNTAQTSLPSLAAAFYPTRGRATGIAWMMGLGRLGGIAGSFLVGELSARKLGFDVIFLALALAAIIAAFALLVKQFATTHAATSIATSKEGTLTH
jgi:AAHS family 4-hydroxybenzoate transporter-like MFS transporter